MLMKFKDAKKNGVTSSVETLTPSDCELFLKHNSHNRDLKPSTVKLYAEQMRNNEWELNGEPIIIADNGDVLDGQHRMYGCIDSQTAFTTLVVKNIPREMFHTIDTGKARNGADVLTINGLRPETAKTCNSAAGLCIPFELFGRIHSGSKETYLSTPAKRAEWVVENKRIVTLAEKIQSFGRHRLISAGQVAFLWFFMEKKNKESSDEFFSGFLSGANLTESDPRLILRNKLESQRMASRKWDRTARLGATIRAWDWYCRGKSTNYPNNIFRDLSDAFGIIKP